jgi:microcystin-dependent protein
MSNPYIGEIRMFGGSFAPLNWAMCSGQPQAISQNTTLYTLIGTTYGGDGVNTFNLPDLRGRLPLHQGQGPGLSTYVIGQAAGAENVTITQSTMGQHNHTAVATANAATGVLPTNSLLGSVPLGSGNDVLYVSPTASPNLVSLVPQTVGQTGSSNPHNNMAPFLCLTFIIALFGVYPSQN